MTLTWIGALSIASERPSWMTAACTAFITESPEPLAVGLSPAIDANSVAEPPAGIFGNAAQEVDLSFAAP